MFSKILTLIKVIGISGIIFLVGCQADAEAVSMNETDMFLTEAEITNPIIEIQKTSEPSPVHEDLEERPSYFAESESFSDRYQAWFDRNPDFVGWISVAEFEISEPVVRGQDNQEYLRADLDGNYRKAGTVFMDYRNIGNDFDPHMILYGHNLKDDQMFGPLRQYLDESMESLPLIDYESLYGREQYRVFSVYRIQVDNYEYQLVNNETYLQDLMDLSQIETVERLQPGVKILTLSTCSYEEKNERLVVHAYRLEEMNE